MAEQGKKRSPIEVTHQLKGIEFPADRDALVAQARENGADDGVMALVEGLPDEEYASIAEVMKGLGKENRDGDDA